jgi:hypothetical protein
MDGHEQRGCRTVRALPETEQVKVRSFVVQYCIGCATHLQLADILMAGQAHMVQKMQLLFCYQIRDMQTRSSTDMFDSSPSQLLSWRN